MRHPLPKFFGRRIGPIFAIVSCALLSFCGSARAQSPLVGFQALLNSYSAASLPAPGTGVVVEQVEAPISGTPGSYAYMPDYTQSQFSGITFTDESNDGGQISSHATNVAEEYYGTNGHAPGVTQVDVYEANDWLSNFLNVGGSTAPAAEPANSPAVANFSWVGSYGDSTDDNDALRRLDYVIDRDNLVAVVCVNNNYGAPTTPIPALLASGYNSIAVGLYSANGPYYKSSTGPVPTGVDGPGRSKPDIVAPYNEVSYAAPDVSAAAAMLVQLGNSNVSLSAGTNAAVVKAILMASADKTPLPTWSHTPTQPLDPQYGAGSLNFESAYQLMTAGPQTAGTTSLSSSTGWSYSSLNPSGSAGNTQTYYFDVPAGQPYDLSALLTWERNIAYTPGVGGSATFTPSLATIDLSLYNANANYSLGSLVDASSSSIDNVQYLFDRALAPGEYALQVSRVDALAGAWNYALAWQTQAVPSWVAGGSGSWATGANWSNNLFTGAAAQEAFIGAPTTSAVNVTLDGPQTIGQLTFANTASSTTGYVLSAGSGGSLTFSNSGNTAQLNITSGSHAISAAVILADSLSVNPAAGTALDISGGATTASGTQTLTLNGAGTLSLDGSNALGGTVVNAGKLVAGGSLSGPVAVNGGGTLSGTGSLASITVNVGGELAPGAPLGAMQVSGSVAIASGAVMAYDLDTPADSSTLLMSGGTLVLSGQQFSDFSFTPQAGFGPGVYTLADAGSIVGSLGSNTSGTIDGLPAKLALQGNDLELDVVPEPGTFALIAAVLVGLGLCRGGRRRPAMSPR